MKVLFIVLCLLCVLLAGCSPRTTAESAAPAEERVETAEFLPEEIDEILAEQIEESGEVPEESAAETSEADRSAELTALFDTLRGRYFPGTAGSSLSAAACAAEMADLFAESGMSPDEADRVARDYIASLSDADAQLFDMQLNGVVSAFSNLCAEGGEALLADCGYESALFPWNDESVRNCFVALLGSD